MFTNLYALLCYGNKEVRRGMLEVFKILNGFDNIDRKRFFVYSRPTLRGYNKKLFKPGHRLNIRKFTFSNRFIDAWNSFPEDIALLIL